MINHERGGSISLVGEIASIVDFQLKTRKEAAPREAIKGCSRSRSPRRKLAWKKDCGGEDGKVEEWEKEEDGKEEPVRIK